MFAPWHLVDVEPEAKIGAPTVGVVVIVWVEVVGPLQPEAVAVTTDVPLQPARKVTLPETELMLLPAPRLVPSRLYTRPVLFVAEAE